MENSTRSNYKEDEECEEFMGEIIEMTWHDLYWNVEIIDNGMTVAEEEVKIMFIKTVSPHEVMR